MPARAGCLPASVSSRPVGRRRALPECTAAARPQNRRTGRPVPEAARARLPKRPGTTAAAHRGSRGRTSHRGPGDARRGAADTRAAQAGTGSNGSREVE